MKKLKDIYCDMGFWQGLSGQLSAIKLSPNLDECKKITKLVAWFDLLCRSNMYFDCSINDFNGASNNDPFLKDLWKRSTDGRCNLDFAPGSINKLCAGPSQMEPNMYSSLFLSQTKHEDEAKKVGVICVCVKELFDHDELFNDNGRAIKRKEVANWSTILASNLVPHNCNSMVIIDNYIFNHEDDNLYKVLGTLLPSSLDTTFYLTVFSVNKGDVSFFDKKRQSLETKIKEIRPELKVKIEVFENSSNEFHDRSIITNYMWVGIGSGFDLIDKQKTGKSTELHVIYPMIISEERVKWSNERYHILIDDAKRCLRIRGKISSNRLLI